jgi:MFS family permease
VDQQPPYGPPPYQPTGGPAPDQPPYGQHPDQPPYGQSPPYYGQPPYGQHPQFDQYYGAMAPKPGCIPLRPLAVGELIGGAFEAIRRNARLVLGLAAVAAVFQSVLAVIVQHATTAQVSRVIDDRNRANPQVHWDQLGKLVGGTVGSSLLAGIFAAVLTGMVIVVVTEDVVGRRADLRLVWSKVRSRLWRLIALSLLVAVLSGLGIVLFVVPGVWLWGIWAVAVPALIVENRGVGKALGRSRSLVGGLFWRVWGIRALGFAITLVAGGAVGAIFTAIAVGVTGSHPAGMFATDATGSLSLTFLIITGFGSALATTFTGPLLAAVDSLLYVDLRMRKEQLAVELQQAATGVRQPSAYYR